MREERMLIGVAIAFCGLFPMIGANLFLYFINKVPGYEIQATKWDYLIINVTMVAAIFLIYPMLKRMKKRHANVPITDERTLLIMKNYFLYVLYFIFVVSGAILLVLFFIGIHTIAIEAILFYFIFLIIVVSIGAFIASRL